MKKMMRGLSLILALGVCIGAAAGCRNQTQSTATNISSDPNLNATGFPIVKKQITLTAMVDQNSAQPDWSQIKVWQEYEKKSNIHIEWQCVPDSSVDEKLSLALASGKLPDMFYRSSMSDTQMIKYGQQGYFVDLSKGIIDQYSPNLKAVMKKFPDVRKGMQTADGHIYAFPGLSNTWPVEVNPKLYINSKWMQTTGESFPKTTDDFYNMLKSFKNKDDNGNGKADEVPLSSTSLSNIVRYFRGQWGLGTRGFGDENFDIDPKGNFRFIPTSEGYKEELEFLNKLYTDGLLDKQIFTMKSSTLLAENEKDQVGAFIYTNVGSVASSNASDFVGLDGVLKGPHGDQLYAAVRGHIATKEGMLITKDCKYPAAAARWIDYFYGEEGAELIYSGIEGDSYTKDSSGRAQLTSKYTTIPAGSSFDQVFSKVSPWAGGGLPAMSTLNSFQGAEMQDVSLKQANAIKSYAPKELWGPFSFTLDENNKKADLESDILTYISQKQAEFVQGKTPFSDFDKYVAQLNSMGLNDYIKLYKTAYERYEKVK